VHAAADQPRDLIGPECLYWTFPEFAVVVRVSDKSLYRLAKNDPTFPCIRIGASLRIPKERALKWLRDREQGARPRKLRAVDRETA
jgi:hypothetical protein